MCPQLVQRRRCTQRPPVARHSTQPVPDGATAAMLSRWVHVPALTPPRVWSGPDVTMQRRRIPTDALPCTRVRCGVNVNEPEVDVRRDPGRGRFTIFVGGEPAGFTHYEMRDGSWAFLHTETDDRFAGRGLATQLIAAALDAVRAEGGTVLPYCPFVRRFIGDRPEYLDLVPAARRAEFELTV